MPKGDLKGKGSRGKRGQQPRKKGRRGDEESDDEDLETQSVASYSSTPGTHSGEEADGLDEGGEEDYEDDFEQVLADYIDRATQKSAQGRQSALFAIQKALKSRIVHEFLSDRKVTIVDCIEKCVKRGTKEDRVLASSIAVLLCVQFGAGSESEDVFRSMKPHLITVIQDQTAGSVARASCATALALCCFIASEDHDELFECSAVLEAIFDNKKTVKPDEVPLYSSILLAWALLLSVTPENQAYLLINKHLRRMMFLLQTSDLSVRIAAGELLALMYEMGRNIHEDFGYRDRNGVCDLIRELATEGNKHIAKKDLRRQRSSFRDILKTIEEGVAPEEVVKFGAEYMELDSWVRRRQYTALKDALGTGVTLHLQENDLLRDIFDLGPQLEPTHVHKTSRHQRLQSAGPYNRQFKAQMRTTFKMSGKGDSVEHEGECSSRLKPLDTAQGKKRVVTRAIDFEAKHKECVRVLPYSDGDDTKVHFYVFSGKSGLPQKLKYAAQECFGEMKVKLEWFDLYNDATEILKATPIEFPLGKPERLSESQIYEINEIINNNLHVLVKHRNVTAVQASFKITNSKQTKQPCIAIYVLGKGSIPVGEFELPRTLGGYDVDVVDGFWFRTDENDPWRPKEGQEQCEVLCLGASIGIQGEEGCGTLGAIVEGDGNFYALSCDHVMKHPQKSEIVHPAADDYLNYLNYHLKQYGKQIQYIIKREQCFILDTQFSFGVFKELEMLETKFQQLKSIKEDHYDQDRAKKGKLEKVEIHEKALEKGFKTPPRVIGRYIAGIFRNVRWTDDQEYFIDAAIAQLTPEEVTGLRESGTVEMIGTEKTPNGRCSSAFTASGELCKSGRTTEYTNSGRHAKPDMYLRRTSYRLNAQTDKHLVDVVKRVSLCHKCANLAGVQEDLEPTFSPCGFCRVDIETLNDELWWKNCLCVDRPYDLAKGEVFLAQGDSGAVIFEIKEDKSLLGFGIIFAQQVHSYGPCALASPLRPSLEMLSRELSENANLRLFSNYND